MYHSSINLFHQICSPSPPGLFHWQSKEGLGRLNRVSGTLLILRCRSSTLEEDCKISFFIYLLLPDNWGFCISVLPEDSSVFDHIIFIPSFQSLLRAHLTECPSIKMSARSFSEAGISLGILFPLTCVCLNYFWSYPLRQAWLLQTANGWDDAGGAPHPLTISFFRVGQVMVEQGIHNGKFCVGEKWTFVPVYFFKPELCSLKKLYMDRDSVVQSGPAHP